MPSTGVHTLCAKVSDTERGRGHSVYLYRDSCCNASDNPIHGAVAVTTNEEHKATW